MNKILILTVLLVLGIIVYRQQSRTAGVAVALYFAGDVIKISAGTSALGKETIIRDLVNNSNITSSVYTNVFKLAHKTVSGWMNSGSSALTVNSETSFSLPAPLYTPIILPTSG